MKKLFLAVAIGVFSLGYSQSGYYDDYRSSVNSFDWGGAIAQLLGLNNNQVSQLTVLNNRYPDYNSWNSAYGNNPNRWYQDRYASMQRIMTPAQYKKFYNTYYKGQNPVYYYGNKHYAKDVQKAQKKYQKDRDKYYKNQDKYYKNQDKYYRKHGGDDNDQGNGHRRHDD